MSDIFEKAPKGFVYKCVICHKLSENLYGFADRNDLRVKTDPGWDESCLVNAKLVKDVDDWRDRAEPRFPRRPPQRITIPQAAEALRVDMTELNQPGFAMWANDANAPQARED